MNELIVGIDLGTTNSAVGVVESRFPLLLANEGGERLTPSVVWLGEGAEYEVGNAARRRRALGGVVSSVKRLMGTRQKVAGHSPEQVSAEILRELKKVAELRLEQEVKKAVITVPAYFNEAQRAATQRAGVLAGLEVVRLLSEPTAAALSYGLDKLEEDQRVAVYDLGGGTFDVSILEMKAGQFEVLATSGDTALGGDDLDRIVVELAGIDLGELEETDAGRVLEEAERVKIALSEAEEVVFRIPFLTEKSVEQTITRADFEKAAEILLGRTEACCRKALTDAGLKPQQIQALVLAGGSTRVPAVRRRAEAIFEQEGREGVDPDEAVALGAAIQAGILSGAVREVLLLDVTPLSLGIETVGGLMNVLIPRNTTIPCKAGEMFTNAAAGQRAMKIRILQGERELAKDNWELGAVEVPFESAEKGQARVGVQFSLDASGLLEVLARDTSTGTDTILTLESSAVDVEDAQVERMVSESVDHAFADMSARVFVEAKLKAEELLAALGPALEEVGSILSEEELAKVREAEEEVKTQMASAEPSGAHLKAAVEQLDDATEQMAALVVEKAMGGTF